MRRRGREWPALIALLLAGAILGGLFGEVLAAQIPAVRLLAQGWGIALGPAQIDLSVIGLTLGLRLKINLLGALGAVIGLFLWWRRW